MNKRRTLATPEIESLLYRMTEGLKHRGPDARGLWQSADEYCLLGHRRLSIIDLSSEANQPMIDLSGRYVIVFNGEIYNFKELKLELESKGHVFRTRSDTEVLLQAYVAYGRSAFERLDGMFAVAIFDRESGLLTLARDRAGEKPLYYISTTDFFAFASELRPLLHIPGVQYELSEEAIALYLALRYVPAPQTIMRGIRKLEPGCVLEVGRDGTETVHRFFSFAANAAPAEAQDIDAFAEQVESALENSLKARLNSDVPLGAFLSSGVDSALVCALLTKRMNQTVRTYTIGFKDDPQSESEEARAIARHLGTDHSEYIFGSSDFDSICERIGELLDEPNGDRSCVPTFLLSQFARQHVKVAISGDGGDELFAGYARYLSFLAKNGSVAWKSLAEISSRYFQTALPVFPWQGIAEVLPDSIGAVVAFTGSFGPLFAHSQGLHALRVLDFRTYLPGAVLAKVDRMSMRHGLEVRTPYLAPQVYKLSAEASVQMCVGDGGQKLVLRKLLRRYLPERHAAAPKKGFGMPQAVFLKNATRVSQELAIAREVLSQTRFFGERNNVEPLMKWAASNINSIWATLVLSKWIATSGVQL